MAWYMNFEKKITLVTSDSVEVKVPMAFCNMSDLMKDTIEPVYEEDEATLKVPMPKVDKE